jgi:hypothetical protein
MRKKTDRGYREKALVRLAAAHESHCMALPHRRELTGRELVAAALEALDRLAIGAVEFRRHVECAIDATQER